MMLRKSPIPKKSSKQKKVDRVLARTYKIVKERSQGYCEIRGPGCLGRLFLSPHHIVHRTEIECTHTPDNIIVGCGMCHNHKKWKDGISISREETYRIILAPLP